MISILFHSNFNPLHFGRNCECMCEIFNNDIVGSVVVVVDFLMLVLQLILPPVFHQNKEKKRKPNRKRKMLNVLYSHKIYFSFFVFACTNRNLLVAQQMGVWVFALQQQEVKWGKQPHLTTSTPSTFWCCILFFCLVVVVFLSMYIHSVFVCFAPKTIKSSSTSTVTATPQTKPHHIQYKLKQSLTHTHTLAMTS